MHQSEDVKPPEGFVKVTKEVFFATVGKLDVHPHPERFHTEWLLRNRQMVGFDTTGYMNSRENEDMYVHPSYAPA